MRNPFAPVAGFAAALLLLLSIGASTAFAKEGVSVNLAAPLPRDAEPGTKVPAFFTMEAISDDVESPLHKASVFIRLYGPAGDMTEAPGVEQSTPGLYKAMIEIPAGGIARGEFGIHGQAKASNGKVVATDPVWAYDGLLVTAAIPPPVDAKTFQLPGTKPAAAPAGGPAAQPAEPVPATSQQPPAGSFDPRLAGAAILALALSAAGVVLLGRRRRLQRSTVHQPG
jgi:hypothetical protein